MFDTYHLHFHFCGVESVLQKLATTEAKLKESMMATKEEVLAAVAAEAGEVAAKIGELQAKIDELIAAGTGATAADLEEIKLAVQAIFTPDVAPE